MANHPCGRRRPPAQAKPAPPPISVKPVPPPTWPEPEVRRWPHPAPEAPAETPLPREALLNYLHCSLSYQNQLLADIKTLLQELQEHAAQSQEEK